MIYKLLLAIAGFLLGVLFDCNNGRNIFLRNVWLSPNYTALQTVVTILKTALISQRRELESNNILFYTRWYYWATPRWR
jgi:hypothetical protein